MTFGEDVNRYVEKNQNILIFLDIKVVVLLLDIIE